jgi:hypothetical protein
MTVGAAGNGGATSLAAGGESEPAVADGPAHAPHRGDALESLTKQLLVQRSLELSPTGYLTIISIIQGVALALLAERTIPHLSWLVGVQAFAVLIMLVFVFYFYMAMTVLLRWPPSILDALLPFVVGALEIPPAFFLGRSFPWSVCAGVFFTAAVGGLIITHQYSPASHFGAQLPAHELFQSLVRYALAICAAAAPLEFGCAFMGQCHLA